MTLQAVAARYEARMLALQSSINDPGSLGTLGLLVAGIILLLTMGLSAIRGEISARWLLLPLPAVFIGVRSLLRSNKTQFKHIRLRRYYQRAIERVQGDLTSSTFTGEEFADSDHVYTSDLNCYGEGSLFHLLCTARTAMGRQRLADYLSDLPTVTETLLRQQAVRELQERSDLREAVVTLGEFEFLESRPQTFEDWLESPAFVTHQWLPIVSAAVSVVLLCLALFGLLGLISWTHVLQWSIPGALLHGAIGLYFREQVNPVIAAVRPLSAETLVLREGLQLLEPLQFQATKLRDLVAKVQGAASAIAKLERPLDVLAQRDQDWFYLPSRYLLAGTQACMALERWRRDHGQSLRQWMHVWAEFEALNALATYSHENPAHTFPEFVTDEECFVAQGLGHPLIAEESCVANDVSLNAATRFYVVSGSNMSGKSTLLRSMGVNAVLAFAGAPVRARKLRLSGLSIVASLSVGDSLMHGKSKFMAEVDRLRKAIESSVEGRPVFFLVDEIFSGTNSRDRRVAAEAVVRTLVNRGALGALSTHDLALTEIAGEHAALGGVNVHLGSKDGTDPMDFDFRVKPGVTTEANALAIARLAGVPV